MQKPPMQGTLAYLNGHEAARLAEITATCTYSIDVTRDELTYLRVVVSPTDAEQYALGLVVNADGMVRAEGEVIWRGSFADWRAHNT
jgi:hypothetical protein